MDACRLGEIHPTAIISEKAKIAKGVTIAANAIIYDNVELGDNVFIGPNSIIGEPLSSLLSRWGLCESEACYRPKLHHSIRCFPLCGIDDRRKLSMRKQRHDS